MKNKLSILTLALTSLFLTSCDRSVPTKNVLPDYYVIYSITNWNGHYCNYEMSNNRGYAYYYNSISVIDSIGKFNVGDTIEFSINKK